MAKRKLEIQLASGIGTALRKTKSSKITAGDLLNHDKLKELCTNDDAYRFMRQITLTPAYLDHKKKIMMSNLRQLGKPTFFMTLSPGTSYWPELIKELYNYKHKKSITIEEALHLSENEKTSLVRGDPVLSVQFFNHRASKMLNYLTQEKNSILNENHVTDYFERTEYQLRGDPHHHDMFYCKNSPEYYPSMSQSDMNVLVTFINRIITCENDENNPYLIHQTHMCTFTCFKKDKKKCRFGFPRFPLKETLVLTPLPEEERSVEIDKNLEKIRTKVKEYHNLLKEEFLKTKRGEETPNFLKSFDTFEQMIIHLEISYEMYVKCLRRSIRHDTVFIKRLPNAVDINNYNKNLLSIWEANIDIQYVLDPYAAGVYLFGYILKTERGLIRLMSEAVKESRSSGLKQKNLMRKVANAFNNVLIIGVSQAVDYLLGTSVAKFSRMDVFVNTNLPIQRIHIAKSKDKLKDQEEDSTDVFEKGLLDKYEKRSNEVDDVCLAEYAADYNETISKGEVKYSKRKLSRIIRFVNYKLEKDSYNYYREQIMLYTAWRNEEKDLINKTESELKKLYENNKEKIVVQFSKYNKMTEDQLKQLMSLTSDDDSETEDDAYTKHDENIEVVDAFPEFVERQETKTAKPGATYSVSIPPRVPDDMLRQMLLKLNTEQREIVDHIFFSFKKGIKNEKIVIFGTAGTGKSFTINSIYQRMTNYCDKIAGDSGNLKKLY